MASTESLTAVQRQLMQHSKLIADSLYELQQQRSSDPTAVCPATLSPVASFVGPRSSHGCSCIYRYLAAGDCCSRRFECIRTAPRRVDRQSARL